MQDMGKPARQTAPRPVRALFRPWLWPVRLLEGRTGQVPPGLWLINGFCQRVLGVNGHVPWMVHFTSRVIGEVTIGRRVWVSFAVSGGCYIQGSNGIEIEDDTVFAPGVKIISANHDRSNLAKLLPGAPIHVGQRCWIGANAVILPGVQLGDDVVVGAGAVVTKSFPSHSVLVGVPARLIRQEPAPSFPG